MFQIEKNRLSITIVDTDISLETDFFIAKKI